MEPSLNNPKHLKNIKFEQMLISLTANIPYRAYGMSKHQTAIENQQLLFNLTFISSSCWLLMSDAAERRLSTPISS